MQKTRFEVVVAIAFFVVSMTAGGGIWLFQGGKVSFFQSEAATRRTPVPTPVQTYAPGSGDALFRMKNLVSMKLTPASFIKIPGVGSDSNSPAEWIGSNINVFNSWFSPAGIYRTSGKSIESLKGSDKVSIKPDLTPNGMKWLESTYKVDDNTIYGWYHFEPSGVCGGALGSSGVPLTAPKIGAMKSTDGGKTWADMGIILSAPNGTEICKSRNGYFVGGVGDGSTVYNQTDGYFYFYYSSYWGFQNNQGLSVARFPKTNLDNQPGFLQKWDGVKWTSSGLGGLEYPIFPVMKSWNTAAPDAFWGPQIHYNIYLNQWVMLLNRSKGPNWETEGFYYSFNNDISNPNGWSAPRKFQDNKKLPAYWYPKIFGSDIYQGTDKVAGGSPRYFIADQSYWQANFSSFQGGLVRIHPKSNSSLCLSTATGDTHNSIPKFTKCDPKANDSNQVWVVGNSNKTYSLSSWGLFDDRYCLDALYLNGTMYGTVQVYPCLGDYQKNQKFVIEKSGSSFVIKSEYDSKKALTFDSGSNTMLMQNFSGAGSQLWSIEEVTK